MGTTQCYVFNQDSKEIPVIILHGGPGFGADPVLVKLLNIKNPVYFYNQFGSGESACFNNPDEYSVDLFISQINDVVNEFGLREIVLFGMCWGAGLAVAYALSERDVEIKGMILTSPFLDTAMWEADQTANVLELPHEVGDDLMRYECKRMYFGGYRKSLIPYFREFYFTRGNLPILTHLVMSTQSDVYRVMWGDSELFCRGKLIDFSKYDDLKNLSFPVILIAGDRDVVRVETMCKFWRELPEGQLAIIPMSGHMIFNEQMEIVKATISSFMADLSDRRETPESLIKASM